MPPNLERPLGNRSTAPHPLGGLLLKVGAFAAGAVLLAILVSRVDLTHDLARLHVSILSGDPQGHYHAIVARTAELARERRGAVTEVTSAGSVENVQRLRAAARSCEVQFALVQDGTDLTETPGAPGAPGAQGAQGAPEAQEAQEARDAHGPGGSAGPLAVYGRFARREAVLFLGKDADRLHEFSELRGMRIGVGPAGSGTEHIARQLFALPDFAGLGVALSTHALDEQVAMLASGSLDLGVFVMQDDAPLVVDAIARRGLQIASFAHTAGIAKRLPHLQTGHVYAGIYDAVRVIPSTDKDVLRVETLLLGNGCAGRTQTVDLLSVLARQFPDFVRHNEDSENTTPLPTAPVAKEFFVNGGPQLADEYVPWLVDVMPPANWAYVVMGVSLLFNAMGAGHRFRLWRIDASRVHLEDRLVALFGKGVTLGDIQAMGSASDPKGQDGAVREGVRALLVDFEELAARSRRQSLSMLVPMGQEMAYRYQESVIYESLTVLRGFLRNAAGA